MEEAREQMLWGLQQADVVKISDEEVEFLFDMKPEEGAAYILEAFGVRLVFVTCGSKGCYFRNRMAAGHVPALEGIRVLDTTGAGDIFGGSALWKLLQLDVPVEDCTEAQLREVTAFACAAAGLSTTRPGGISSVPDYTDTIEKMEQISL